eukprot:scaffold27391_cov67-Attheya_sp.AAC.4
MAAPGLSASAASCAHLRVPGVVVLMFSALPREPGACDSRFWAEDQHVKEKDEGPCCGWVAFMKW